MTRVALVTGSTSGIGVVVAQQLIEDGFTVAISGRSTERGEEVARSLGDRARFFRADLTGEGNARALVEEVAGAYGRLDVLVNNAAIDHTGDLLEVTEQDIRDTFETNTFAAMNLAIAAARQMRGPHPDRAPGPDRAPDHAPGGSIINVTSRLASIGVPTMGIYSASKGAMHAFTRAAAVDLAQYNIRVNAVAPGMTRTPLYQEWIESLPDPEAEAKKVAAAVPMGRIAEPEDVAAVVRFLASPEAAYLTGASIPVEGGYLAT